MSDLLLMSLTIGFFALCIGYVNGCERLRGGGE